MTDSQLTPDNVQAVDSSHDRDLRRTPDSGQVSNSGGTLASEHGLDRVHGLDPSDLSYPASTLLPVHTLPPAQRVPPALAVSEAGLAVRENPFHTPAPLYGRVRPAYPAEAVHAVCGGHAAGTIADIGAGTGKLSALLLEGGAHVVAIEPSEAMREQLRSCCGNSAELRVIAATAEDTTLPDDSVDVAAYAQSWHWMDSEEAGREADRIVRPGGHLAIMWNQMNVELPWVHRLTRIMRSGDVHRPDKPPRLPEPWAEPELTMLAWEDQVTPEGLLELGTTRSSYLRQNEAGRKRMQENLRWYLYEHLEFSPGQEIALPYTTQVWVSHRRVEL